MSGITPGDFWRALGERPIGVTLVTCKGKTGPQGFLGLSAVHVSASPPRMVVSVSQSTSAIAGLLESQAFAINVMPEGTEAIVQSFGSKDKTNEERFASSKWSAWETGSLIHEDALSAFDCRVVKTLDLDGTLLVVGDVVKLGRASVPATPLLAWRGQTVPLKS